MPGDGVTGTASAGCGVTLRLWVCLVGVCCAGDLCAGDCCVEDVNPDELRLASAIVMGLAWKIFESLKGIIRIELDPGQRKSGLLVAVDAVR